MQNTPSQRAGNKRTILGIDLRVFSVKIAEIEMSGVGAYLRGWGVEEFIGANPQQKALQTLLNRTKIKTKEAAVCVSGPDVVLKHLALPKLSKAEVLEAVKLQIPGWVSFPLDEAVFDFILLKESGGQNHYLVAIARQKVIYDALAVCKSCGLNVAFITVVPFALLNNFHSATQDKDASVCLMYMGKHATNINIFKGGVFEFNREISLGGDYITSSMVGVVLTDNDKIEIDYAKAEELKRSYGIPLDLEEYTKQTGLPAVQVLAFMRPALEKIEAELLRSFSYYRSQTGNEEINRIIITGGASKTQHLIDLLKGALGVPVEQGVPTIGADPAIKASLPDLAVAIGAALESKDVRVNLLPEEIKNRFFFLLKKMMAPRFLAIFLAGFLVLLYLAVWGWGFALDMRLAEIEKQITVLSPKAAQFEVLESKLSVLENGRTVFSNILGLHKQVRLALQQVGRLIPNAAVLSNLSVAEVGEAVELNLTGSVFSYQKPKEEVLADFLKALNNLDGVTDVLLISADLDASYTQPALDFNIKVTLGKNRNEI
ncbi:MAG: pilus assembly protein PilM [Candidatus Saganbacteria bacterium]|nr:pilus assembly protein PilM [Candidatus Saganbacteria bacterium]